MPDVPGVTNWPAAPDSAVSLIQVRDLASTTLTADIDDNDMTLNVGSTSGWPSASVVTVEGEHIVYSAKTSTTITVATGGRGAFTSEGGSAAAGHLAGATVAIKVIAASHRVLADAIMAIQAKQGAGADTPAAGEFNKGTGTGTSGWSPLAGSEVNTALGYTAADAATLTSHVAASNPHSGAQPLDAELSALAGLTSAADRLPYFTGSGAAALATFTAAGRALVDDTDAATQRATLGLGTLAQQGAGAVAITGGTITGITDLAIADGGTGASTAANARTNLGLVIGTDVQAQDAELQALAGLTSAANKLPYFTGSGTAGLTDISAAGRALIDDADTTAQRATLGLVIGADVQAYDAELSAIAGLTSAANKGIQFTGAGAAATFDLTTAGKALLDDADAAAQRATLGLVIGTNVQAYDADLGDLANYWNPASSASGAKLVFREDTDLGTDKVVLQTPTDLVTDANVTLPSASGVLALQDEIGVISDFSSAPHDHQDAAGGGVLGPAAMGVMEMRLDADYTANNVATAQKVFNIGTFGAANPISSTTYDLEALYHIDTTGTASHTLAIVFGGTAVFSLEGRVAVAPVPPAGDLLAAVWDRWMSLTSGTALVITNATAAVTHSVVYIRGTLRVSTGGTLIPQFKWNSAPGGTTKVIQGTMFRITPIGSSTMNTIGNIT